MGVKMTAYLAARHSRAAELRRYREELRGLGVEVTSRWLDGDYPTGPDGKSLIAPDEVRARVALEDLADLMAADVFIAFTEPGRSDGRGGRHVEMGIALASGKRCIVIGPRENVFCCLESVRAFAEWGYFLQWLILEDGRRA